MSTSNKGGIGVLLALILAMLFALVCMIMMGIPGIVIFEVADIPLSFLPQFNGEYELDFGVYYGSLWALIMVGVYIAAVNRHVPEKWKKSPKTYKFIYMMISTVVMSILLAMPFHVYASWKTHHKIGSERRFS
jgi:hypothetical protein